MLICGRNEEKLRRARTLIPALEHCVADVAIASDRKKLRDWIATEHPAMNMLVNNAGLQRRIDFVNADTSIDFSEIMTNFAAPIALTAELLPHLRAHAARGTSATVINVTSGLGYVPLAATPVYCATKSGMQAFTRALRHQLRATGVRVVDIAPPAVDTELLRGAQDPARRATGGPPMMTPQAFVTAALGALARGRTDIRVGGAQRLYVLNRLAPDFALRLLNRLAS